MFLSDLRSAELQLRCLVAAGAPPADVGEFAATNLTRASDRQAQGVVAVQAAFRGAPEGSRCQTPEARRLLGESLAFAGEADAALASTNAAERESVAARLRLDVMRTLGALSDTAVSVTGASGDRERLGRFARHLITDAVLAQIEAKIGLRDEVGTPAGPEAVGRRVYAAYGRTPPFFTFRRRDVMTRVLSQPPTAPFASDAFVSSIVWGQRLNAEMGRTLDLAPAIATVVAAETQMPPELADPSAERLRARVDAYEFLEVALGPIEQAERAYAATLGKKGTAAAVTRAPLVDVATFVAYHRVCNHADPYLVFHESMAATGGEASAAVARGIEVALIRRYAYASVEHTTAPGPDGSETVRRPLGWNLDPRVREAIVAAHDTNEVGPFLRALEGQVGRDQEHLRADAMATKLADTSLVLEALAGIRPVATGERDTVPEWSDAARAWVLAPDAESHGPFVESEGPNPVLNADGELVAWHTLVDRHPRNRLHAPASAARRVTAEDSSWIESTPEQAVAFAPLLVP